MLRPENRSFFSAILIAVACGALGCRGQQSVVPNPFVGADRVPPPTLKTMAPGTATPYYQGDPLPPYAPPQQQLSPPLQQPGQQPGFGQPPATQYPAAPAWPQTQASYEEPVHPGPAAGVSSDHRISLLNEPDRLPTHGVVLTGGEAATAAPLQWGPSGVPTPEFQPAPPSRISFPGE
ncbi:hypothetical protein Pla175_20650 [Pirellulimonas nuda]|uniref:Uncharacterized protein n=1 Tax=Pirellulimonas nuda TaxID=2528009 RepID=A0A518DB28_9BACT|nr:hypothetical protein Pla175_20650 [Pirellulimonas nuda]